MFNLLNLVDYSLGIGFKGFLFNCLDQHKYNVVLSMTVFVRLINSLLGPLLLGMLLG